MTLSIDPVPLFSPRNSTNNDNMRNNIPGGGGSYSIFIVLTLNTVMTRPQTLIYGPKKMFNSSHVTQVISYNMPQSCVRSSYSIESNAADA